MAFAGLGTAFSVLFVTLSYLVSNLSLSFTVIASIGTIFPLTKKYYREALLCCIATSIIGFFIANIRIIPYIMACSFYIVFTVFWFEKKYNKYIGYGIKILYSVLTFFILYKLANLIIVDFSKITFIANIKEEYLYFVLNFMFSICFIIFDILIIQGYLYMRKIVEKMIK